MARIIELLLSDTITYNKLKINGFGQLMLTIALLAAAVAVIFVAVHAPQHLAGIGLGGGIVYGGAKTIWKKLRSG
jgi:hypothetical protein